MAMAPGAANALVPGGPLVLSGILTAQADEVQEAYRKAGFDLVDRMVSEEWVTLIVARPN